MKRRDQEERPANIQHPSTPFRRAQLAARGLEPFLPLWTGWSHWKDRRKQIATPLFPGYCFARFQLSQKDPTKRGWPSSRRSALQPFSSCLRSGRRLSAGPIGRPCRGRTADNIVPRWLRRLWNGWKIVAETIGRFQSRLVLVVLYFLIVSPFALFVRLCRDPLRIKTMGGSNWIDRRSRASGLEGSRRQF